MNLSPFLLICPFIVLCTLGFLLLLLPNSKKRSTLVLFGFFLIVRAPLYWTFTAFGYLPAPFLFVIECLGGYLALLFEPLLFFAFVSFILPVKLIFKRCWPLLLPSAVFGSIYLITFLSYPNEIRYEIAHSFWNAPNIKQYQAIFRWQLIIQIIVCILQVTYLTLYTKVLVFDFRKFLRDNFSNREKLNIKWIIIMGLCFVLFTIFYTFINWFGTPAVLLILIMEIGLGFLTVFVLVGQYSVDGDLLGYYFTSFLQKGKQIFFVRILFPPRLIPKIPLTEEYTEPSKEELSLNKMDYLFQKLISYFEREKPYLQKNLCLNDVAKGLNSNRTYISQLLTQKKNISFYDFVNTYRIDEVKQRIRNQPNLSLNCIAEECGFCSYTTFVKYFTKKENLNPMEWKNKHL